MRKDEIFWWRDAPPTSPPQQDVSPVCDVAVIGGGYTGLSAALTLAKAGRSVQVFDREAPGFGASSRNGGITSGSLRQSCAGAVRIHGIDRATAMFREAANARCYLASLVQENGIDCDYRMTGRFTGALVTGDVEAMQKDADLLHEMTGVETKIITGGDLSATVGSDRYLGGEIRPDIGTIQPAKLHSGLMQTAIRAGVIVHGETAVTATHRTTDGFTLDTARGRLTCGDVVFATNGYTDRVNPWLRRRIVPIKSRIVVTEELSENLVNTLIPEGRAMGEKRRLSRYYRPTPDGKRIALGMRTPYFGDPAEFVRTQLAALFPQLNDVSISASWDGNVAFSRRELPLLFQHDGMQYAMGYCGSGTVWAPWLGHQAALNILNPNGPKSFFDAGAPALIPAYEGRPWFIPAAIAWQGLLDRLDGRK